MSAIATNESAFLDAQQAYERGQAFCLFKHPNSETIQCFYGSDSPTAPEARHLIVQPWGDTAPTYFVKGETQAISVSTPQPPAATSVEAYTDQFEEYQLAFAETDLQKAILSRIKNIDKPSDFNAFNTFHKLCEQRTNTFNYLLNHPTAGLWMGASPEALLRKEGNKFQTVSLAGTLKKSAPPYPWTDKEKEEQELVSEHIRTILADSSAQNLKEVGPYTSEAGNVVHLKTDFLFELAPEKDLGQITEKLHPTPAIAGLPVNQAVEIIEKVESHDRSLYTGFIGEVSSANEANLYVNLRCMQIHADTISIYVGGGITAQSDLHAEWEETEEKSKTLISVVHD